jgi:hypothetical protein
MEAKLLAPGLPFPAAQRRTLGFLLGAAMGLLYGLISTSINRVVLPGIPLYPPPPGPALQVLGSAAGGAVLGLLAAWPREGLIGIVFSAATGAAAISLSSVVTTVERQGLVAPILITFYTFLPRLFFYLPFAGLVRWGVTQWREAGPPPPFDLRRHGRVVLITLGIAAAIGGCSLRSPEAREALSAMDAIMRQAAQATTVEELPAPLREVDGFLAEASGDYTLEWSDEIGDFQAAIPVGDEGQTESLILIRYESGLRFRCVFSPPIPQPTCVR